MIFQPRRMPRQYISRAFYRPKRLFHQSRSLYMLYFDESDYFSFAILMRFTAISDMLVSRQPSRAATSPLHACFVSGISLFEDKFLIYLFLAWSIGAGLRSATIFISLDISMLMIFYFLSIFSIFSFLASNTIFMPSTRLQQSRIYLPLAATRGHSVSFSLLYRLSPFSLLLLSDTAVAGPAR